MHPEWVLRLGWAAGHVLTAGAQGRPRVVIGKDTRLSGYLLESALESGLAAAGVDVLLVGPLPTPAIAYLTRTLRESSSAPPTIPSPTTASSSFPVMASNLPTRSKRPSKRA
jgi:phosphomannomutase